MNTNWTQILYTTRGRHGHDSLEVAKLMSLAWLAVFNTHNSGVANSLLINQHAPDQLMGQLDYHNVPVPYNLEQAARPPSIFFPTRPA